MKNRYARMLVAGELIAQALALPAGAEIISIENDHARPDTFVFTVEHCDFSPVGRGQLIPEITPVFTTDPDNRPDTWITCEWGKPRLPPQHDQTFSEYVSSFVIQFIESYLDLTITDTVKGKIKVYAVAAVLDAILGEKPLALPNALGEVYIETLKSVLETDEAVRDYLTKESTDEVQENNPPLSQGT